MKKEFITYGFKIDLNRINPKPGQTNIGFNRFVNKPDFGLWGSPTDVSYGWKEWCIDNYFKTDTLDVYTKWELKPEANILVINSFEDFINVMDMYGKIDPRIPDMCYLDFSRIMKDYDGMWVTGNGNMECHYPQPYKKNIYIDLNAWDCDSIVVWNPDVVNVKLC